VITADRIVQLRRRFTCDVRGCDHARHGEPNRVVLELLDALEAERDGELVGQHAMLREAVRWLAQTVHQAHHEGHIDECPKSTCQHAVDVLKRTA